MSSGRMRSSAGARHGVLGLVLVVAGLMAVQVEMTARNWTRPFLDGGLHYDYDNADFTRRARDGIRVDEARTQLGLTEQEHEAWGIPIGPPTFYTHHPFLLKALFQQIVRMLGDEEWVSRVYALSVSMAGTAGAVLALRLASRSLLAAAMGGLVLVSLPVFALYQACIKYEIDGMVAGTWFFVAVTLALARPARVRAWGVGAMGLVCGLAHWTAVLFVGFVVAWLVWEWRARARGGPRDAAAAASVGVAAGLVAVLATFAWLSGGWDALRSDLGAVSRVRSDLSAFTWSEWVDRQSLYVRMNFGPWVPWVAVALSVGWLQDLLRAPPGSSAASQRTIGAFFLCTLGAALVWQLGFPQGSYVHVYWQLWFALPIATLTTAVVARVRAPAWSTFVPLAVALLAAWLNVQSRALIAETLQLQRGTKEDIAFLASQRLDRFARFVFVPIHDEAFNSWFAGPAFRYYTDRAVISLARAGRVTGQDRVLVLKHEGQAELVTRLGHYLGVALVAERCSTRICAYDVRP